MGIYIKASYSPNIYKIIINNTESDDKISMSTSFSIYFLTILGTVYFYSLFLRFINGNELLSFSNRNDFLILDNN